MTSPEARADAVARLDEMSGPAVEADLATCLDALRSEWPQVRAASIRAIDRLPPHRATRLLTEHLVYERHVPAGRFTFGVPDDSPLRVNSRPRRTLHLSAYYIAKHPVTNGEFAAFLAETSAFPPPDDWSGAEPPEGERRLPVGFTTWEMAAAYAEWAAFRLPSEAEWEKAARGGHHLDGDRSGSVPNPQPERLYPWGDEPDPARCNVRESGLATASPVGQYSPQGDSPYGVADMAGNVWEWINDFYDESYYDTCDDRDPTGPESGQAHLFRGGSFNNTLDLAVVTYCLPDVYPSARFRFDSFRLALGARQEPE